MIVTLLTRALQQRLAEQAEQNNVSLNQMVATLLAEQSAKARVACRLGFAQIFLGSSLCLGFFSS